MKLHLLLLHIAKIHFHDHNLLIRLKLIIVICLVYCCVTSVSIVYADVSNSIHNNHRLHNNNLDQDNPFFIQDIHTFVDSGNLEDSKEIANNSIAIEAFRRLIERVVSIESSSKFTNYLNTINNFNPKLLVTNIYPVKERMTSHSYSVFADVLFDNQKVKLLLNKSGVSYSDKYRKTLIVIPILHLADAEKWQHILWQKSDWKNAWNNLDPKFGLIRTKVVIGNLDDIQTINSRTLLTDNYEHFTPLINRSLGDGVMIVWAELYNTTNINSINAINNHDKKIDQNLNHKTTKNNNNNIINKNAKNAKNFNKLDVMIRFLSANSDVNKYLEYTQDVRENEQSFYQRVVYDILQKIDSDWKGENSFANQNVLYTSLIGVKADRDYSNKEYYGNNGKTYHMRNDILNENNTNENNSNTFFMNNLETILNRLKAIPQITNCQIIQSFVDPEIQKIQSPNIKNTDFTSYLNNIKKASNTDYENEQLISLHLEYNIPPAALTHVLITYNISVIDIDGKLFLVRSDNDE